MHWGAKSEKPPSLLTKTENQRLNWRKLANRTRHQNRKTEPKISHIRETENPNAPLNKQRQVVF